MHELAYDKDANPLRFARRTRKLRVRRWKNAGQRGTCAVVLDADGEPLLVDSESGYGAFRKTVSNVPGFYRLDQCDQDGVPVDDAPPAYVEIEPARNSGYSGELDPRDSVIRDLAQINADMCRSITERFGNMMLATAEILRAADGAGLPRREAPPALPPPAKADKDDDDDDDDEDDDDDDSRPEPSERLLVIIEQMMPTLQMWLASLAAKRSSSLPPATTPPVPEPAAPPPLASSAAPDARGVVAGVRPYLSVAPEAIPHHAAPSATAAPSEETTANLATSGDEPTTALPTTSTAPNIASAAHLPTDGARNALAAEPTQEQWAHLISVRAHLSPREAAIAEAVVVRMTPAMRVQWLGELSTLPPQQAAELVRSMIPKRAPKPSAPRPDATTPDGIAPPAPTREESEE